MTRMITTFWSSGPRYAVQWPLTAAAILHDRQLLDTLLYPCHPPAWGKQQ